MVQVRYPLVYRSRFYGSFMIFHEFVMFIWAVFNANLANIKTVGQVWF